MTALVAWSAFAFGAVYPWAWRPLLAAAGLLGIIGLVFGRRPSDGMTWVIALWMLSGLFVGLQVLPLSLALVEKLSPAAIGVLTERNLSFAQQTHHPLSIEPSLTATALIFVVVFGLFLTGLDRLLTTPLIDRLTKSILTIGVALSLVGFVQRASPFSPLYGFWQPEQGYTYNAFGPFINRNHFAGWMVMGCGLGLGYLMGLLAEEQRHQTWRSLVVWLGRSQGNRVVMTTFALGTMMLATIWSVSRSGIVSLAVVVLATLVSARSNDRGSRKMVLTSAIIVSLVAGAMLWRGLDVLATRFSTPDSLNTRLAAWQDTWSIFRDFPLIGTGLNTYTVATLFYQRSNEGLHLAEAHNDYLQLLSDGGILVTIPVVGTIAAIIGVIRNRWRSPGPYPRINSIQRGAAIGLLGISVQEIAEFSLQKPANALLFVILLAIAMYEPSRSHPLPPKPELA